MCGWCESVNGKVICADGVKLCMENYCADCVNGCMV